MYSVPIQRLNESFSDQTVRPLIKARVFVIQRKPGLPVDGLGIAGTFRALHPSLAKLCDGAAMILKIAKEFKMEQGS